MHNLCNPLGLLGRDVRGRRNSLGWIDQEEDQDLSVSGFGGVLQVEWLDLMLIQVREGDASVSLRDNVTNILDQRRVPERAPFNSLGYGIVDA